MNTTCYTQIESPLGPLLLAADDAGLRHIVFAKEKRAMRTDPAWHEDHGLFTETIRQLTAYFAGKLETFNLPLAPHGTRFQLDVWKHLCDIPYGGTIFYRGLAPPLRQPNASPAGGLAHRANPLSLVLPRPPAIR